MKKYIDNIKIWLEKDPKRTFKMFMAILGVSFVLMIITEIYNKNNLDNKFNSKTPYLFENSEAIIQKQKLQKKQKSMNEIKKELNYFKTKEMLSKNDSIRIEFLLDRLNYMKNEE